MSNPVLEPDFIVVGGGTAGCVVAARLAEDPQVRVLLIEAGANSRHPWVQIPLGYGKLLHSDSFVHRYYSQPEPNLGGRQLYMPRGRVIGGSGSVNGSVFVRGEPARFDLWAQLGCPGWSYTDVLPYFKRLETFAGGDSEWRGSSGPLSVTRMDANHDLTGASIAACREVGLDYNEDYNGATTEGVSLMQLSTRRGFRCSTAVAYLDPARDRRNLEVLTETQVQGITFDGTLATGVRIRRDDGSTAIVRAKAEVILCAGAIQSPQLLERSGVGDAKRLRALSVPVAHDLPGVGENLQDHLSNYFHYECTQPLTVNDALRNPWYGFKMALEYAIRRGGHLATPGARWHALVRSAPGMAMPDIKIMGFYLSGQDKFAASKSTGLDRVSGFSLCGLHLFPKSRGSTHIADLEEGSHPLIQVNHLSHPDDQAATISAMRWMERIGDAAALAPFVRQRMRPPRGAALSDNDLLDYTRETGQTAHHPIGTCAMGQGVRAVVDEQLRVHGLRGLRVVDASVMPIQVSSNTNAPTIMLAERASDLIRGRIRTSQRIAEPV